MKKILMIACVVLSISAAVYAESGDDILGVWLNQEKDAKIEIYKCSDKFCGKIVWLKEPDYPEGSTEGAPRTPKLDHNNADSALKKMPLIGLQVVRSFTYIGENEWGDGKVYDPKNGKTYSGKLTLVSQNQLKLRGYIGISLLGRNAVWTR